MIELQLFIYIALIVLTAAILAIGQSTARAERQ